MLSTMEETSCSETRLAGYIYCLPIPLSNSSDIYFMKIGHVRITGKHINYPKAR